MNTERRPGTRLPDDPRYWESLAERSVDAALGASRARLAAGDPWWRLLSDASFALAASAVLALIGGSLLLGARSPAAAAEPNTFAAALAPDDPLLGSLVNPAVEPPPASVLLALIGLREEQR
jgi:hypothetical protein